MSAKRTKRLLLILPLLSGLLFACLCLFAPIQTWLANHFIAAHLAPGSSLQRLSIGLQGLEVSGLRLADASWSFEAPRLYAKGPLWRLVLGELSLNKVEASACSLHIEEDTGNAPAAQATASTAPTELALGLLQSLRLPVALSVDRLQFSGTLQVPASVTPNTWSFNLSLNDLKPSAEALGTLEFVPVSKILPHQSIYLAVRMADARSFSSLRVSYQPAPGTASSLDDFSGSLTWSQDPKGEHLDLAFSREGRTVLQLHSNWLLSASLFHGQWNLAVSPGDLPALSQCADLASARLWGSGAFSLNVASKEWAILGNLDLALAGKASLSPDLPPLGPLALSLDADLACDGASVLVKRLKSSGHLGSSGLLHLTSTQIFSVALGDFSVAAENPEASLLSLDIRELPLNLAKPWLPASLALEGDLSVALECFPQKAGFRLSSSRDFRLFLQTLSFQEATQVSELVFKGALSGDFLTEGWQLDVPSLSLIAGQQPLGSLQLRLGTRALPNAPLLAQGALSLNLPVLFDQALFSEMSAKPVSGQASFSFKGSHAADSEWHASGSLAKLNVSENALPELSWELSFSQSADGSLHALLPFTLRNPLAAQESVCLLEASLAKTDAPRYFKGKFEARELHLDDISSLAALFSWSEQASVSPSTKSPANSVLRPFWAPYTGEFSVQVDRLEGASCSFGRVLGMLSLTEQSLSLTRLSANDSSGASLSLTASLGFSPTQVPYALEGTLKATDFDVSSFMEASSGERFSPSLSGRFSMDCAFQSAAASPELLAASLSGSLQLLSKGGRFRMLRSDISEFLQGKSGLGAAVRSGLGALLSSKKNGEASVGALDEYAQVAVELADFFAEVPYDQLSVTLSRAPEDLLRVSDFALLSPQLRMVGEGSIDWTPERSFASSPLSLTLTLSTRARLAELFGRADLLAERKDDLGYLPLKRPIHIRGLVADPDSAEFKKLLGEIALRQASDLLDRVFGGNKR